MPANLQSTIGARIDRLPAAAKKTLNAASVIGLRFDADLLNELVDDADIAPLVAAEVVDQVSVHRARRVRLQASAHPHRRL